MKLFHGTSQKALLSIIPLGIRPVRLTGSIPTNRDPCNSRMVYLTSWHGPYYAFRRCCFDQSAKGAILEIETDLINANLLTVDERALEQQSRGLFNHPENISIEDRRKFYQDAIDAGKLNDVGYEESLRLMGSCSYPGTIPLEALTRIVLFDIHHAAPKVFGLTDPSITTFNHRVWATKNMVLTKQLFGDIETEDRKGIEVFVPKVLDFIS